MQYRGQTEIGMEDLPFEVEPARLRDLHDLTDFAKTRAAAFDPALWKHAIAAHNVVCAKRASGTLAGFYVVNHLAESEQSERTRAAFQVLCNRLRTEGNVAFGAHAVVETSFGGGDLRLHLLRGLLRGVCLRYRYLFTEVPNGDLLEMELLAGEGWRCFREEDDFCYMVLSVSQALRQLPTRLLLRPPGMPTRPANTIRP